jgi:uncharacterized protein (DUF58 family)
VKGGPGGGAGKGASGARHLLALVAPCAVVAYAALERPRDGLARAALYGLGPPVVATAAALAARAGGALFGRRGATAGRAPLLAELGVLTGRGRALGWLSAAALACALGWGYASFAAVGVLGAALFYIAAAYGLVVLRAPDPLRAGAISRRFSPETAVAGGPLVESVTFDGARVPLGARLFVTGRIGPRWATCRHVLTSSESGALVVAESDVGPAVRGRHRPEPLRAWLEDAFGLCRSLPAEVPGPTLLVTPPARDVSPVAPLLAHGPGPNAARPRRRLPTEGAFELRDYHPGDDVRRVHWVRSAAAGRLVVRRPDEVPPDRPHVRLVLDTYFPRADVFESDEPARALDDLVAVWLGVARALVAAGARVALVTAVPAEGEGAAVVRHDASPRAANDALRLGARVAWQRHLPVEALLTGEPAFVVARAVTARLPPAGAARWIVVPPAPPEPAAYEPPELRLPLPMGAHENRRAALRGARAAARRLRRDRHLAAHALSVAADRPTPGSFVAVAASDGAVRLEAVR